MRLIDADVASRWMEQNEAYMDAEILRAIPTVDVVPVVHGRWEYSPQTINTYGQLRCSICNWWTLDLSVDHSYSYCPNCGAKMDGGADDEV